MNVHHMHIFAYICIHYDKTKAKFPGERHLAELGKKTYKLKRSFALAFEA